MALKVAIIGLTPEVYAPDVAGHDASMTHVSALQNHAQLQLIAVCDANQFRQNDFLKYHQNVAIFSDPIEMMSIERPEVLCISTWPDTHARLIDDLVRYQPRVIVLNPPLSFSLNDAAEIIATCRQNDIEVVVNFSNRFDARLQELSVALQHGLIGNVLGGHICFASGSGNGSRAIDTARQLLGTINGVQAYADCELKGFDAQLNGRLIFGRNTSVTICSPAQMQDPLEISINGSLGHLHLFNGGRDLALHLSHDHYGKILTQFPTQVEAQEASVSLIENIALIANGMLKNPSDAISALQNLNVVLALQESHFSDGKIINLRGDSASSENHLSAEEIFLQL